MFTNILINKFKNIFEQKKIKNLLINKWETSLKKINEKLMTLCLQTLITDFILNKYINDFLL